MGLRLIPIVNAPILGVILWMLVTVSGSINRSWIMKEIITWTFFSDNNTTESFPLIATAVNPQVLTALNAY